MDTATTHQPPTHQHTSTLRRESTVPPPSRSKQSFATFLILCPTSFFLGILFSLLPYDYPILWTSTPLPLSPASNPPNPSSPTALAFTILETHLRTLHASPSLIPRILHIVIFTGILGFTIKLYRPSESNLLFDGASLVLYVCGIIVYVTNIVRGLRAVSAGDYGGGEAVVGREDGLRVLSASHTILALVLVGVLVLQAGQWYAERKEGQEMEEEVGREREREREQGVERGRKERERGERERGKKKN